MAAGCPVDELSIPVAAPTAEGGRQAVRELLERIAGGRGAPGAEGEEPVVLPTRLVVRGSSWNVPGGGEGNAEGPGPLPRTGAFPQGE